MENIIIVIPAYEPDKRLLALLAGLAEKQAGVVILVNDGSGSEYDAVFREAMEIIEKMGGKLLIHKENRGKGRALKTAFQYALDHYPEMVGAVTADSDGQHTTKAILEVGKALLDKPGDLILGVRNFKGEDIPWKSRFGNQLTEKIFTYLAGVHVSDTQTGLRGIPRAFMRQLLDVRGERFEFEMRMLMESVGKYDITEVAIETVYDSKENHQTHFHPVLDSIRIYRILGGRFLKYIFTSFSSSVIDLVLFTIFCMLLKQLYPYAYIAVATVAARVVSAIYNYILNYKMVFNSEESLQKAGIKYAALAVAQMGLSAALVTLFAGLFPAVPETIVKVVVDVALFFVSYRIQQQYVFAKR